MSEIFHLVIGVAPVSRSNPQGLAAEGWYRCEGNRVIVCDQDGAPTGKEATLAPGDVPRVIAARLLRRAWEESLGKSDFFRPLGHADYEIWKY